MVEPIVEIKQGKLKGKICKDYNDKNYCSFQGIPYAKPPIGELRFKAPVPPEPWKGIFDATEEGNECLALDLLENKIVGSEDCLILNVYTPELPNNGSLKPVMIWIHGGAFVSGSSKTDFFGPEFLLTEDVVIVSINYRLGILGFLSLEDTSLGVPGNNGLKDMVLALKWVQNNIKHFNGDPNNVTLFGASAGGAACNFLIISELTKGLFHRAILQSGVCINPWARGSHNAIQISQAIDNNAITEKELLEYLMEIPALDIVKAQTLILDDLLVDKIRPFGPVIEKPNQTAFMTEDPLDLMLSGKYNKVPIILGYNNREGMFLEVFLKLKGVSEFVYRMNDFQSEIPWFYNVEKGSELSKSIAKKMEEFYYGVSQTPEEDIDKFYIITTDTLFARGIHVTAKALLKTNDQSIYFYRFNYETALNIFKVIGNLNRPGVCHADETGYLFKCKVTPEIESGSVEDIALRRVVKLWTNFAKTGNPNLPNNDTLINIEWPQMTSNNFQCLDIDKELTISENPEEDRMKFWDDIGAMHGLGSIL